LDDASVDRLTRHRMDHARKSGALAELAGVLAFRSALVDGLGGRLAAAWQLRRRRTTRWVSPSSPSGQRPHQLAHRIINQRPGALQPMPASQPSLLDGRR
jgi:hypothetical protein